MSSLVRERGFLKNGTLRIESLKKKDKNEYWGTSVRKFVTNGVEKFSEEWIIYINFRDVESTENFLEIIAHEVNHLTENSISKEDMIKLLEERIDMAEFTSGCTRDLWMERMKDKPCYAPCPPFYDMCGNADSTTVKHMDCDKCFEENPDLKDYIE